MGMMNYAVNRMLERKETFADFVNGVLFDGKDFLHSENLELLSANAGMLYRDEKNKLRVKERRGDIRVKASEELYSLIIAAEPQDKIHYAMPIRVMEYVTMEYRKQIQELEKHNKAKGAEMTRDEFLSGIRREDKLMPVIAIVFYCGEDWDGSKSLYDLLAWGVDSDINQELKRYLPDFKLNLVQISDLENVKKFKTSLQYIFEMIKYKKDKRGLKEYIRTHRQELQQMDEVEATAAFALLGQNRVVEELLTLERIEEKEELKMNAFDELLEDERIEGRDQGIADMNELVRCLTQAGRIDDLIKSTSDAAYQQRLFEEFGLTYQRYSSRSNS